LTIFFSHLTNSLFKNEVENASIKLRAHDERNWPSFLYPEGTAYNELELDKGLFHGHVFLRVRFPFYFYILSSPCNIFQGLHAIFTGKSSAFTGHRAASKPSQAEMHGMRQVFPEAVAYAAVQVRLIFKSLYSSNLRL
jgi:hypothetical protein